VSSLQSKNNKQVVVSNQIIDSKSDFKHDSLILTKKHISSIDAQKLFFIAISKIANAKRDNKSFVFSQPIFVQVKEITKITGLNSNGLYTRIKDAAKVLSSSFIESYAESDVKKRYFTMTSLVSKCEYVNENGVSGVYIKLNPDLENELIIDKNFTQLSLESIVNLSSKHAIKLYSLLKYHHDYSLVSNRDIEIELDRLKFLLNVENVGSYSNFYLFKTYVLDTAVNEINEKTELSVNFNTSKTGKKISHIMFNVKINDMSVIKNQSLQELSQKKDLVKVLADIGCDKKFINHILKSFEIDFVEYLIKKVEERNPENKGAYLNFLSSEPSIKNEFEVNRADEIELKNKKEREIKSVSNDEIMEEIERNRNKLLSKMRV
jgi:plasmid replication initiation protein